MYIYLNHCTIWYDIINFAYFQGGESQGSHPSVWNPVTIWVHESVTISQFSLTLKIPSRSPLCVLILALAMGLQLSPIHWMYTNFMVGMSSTTSVCVCVCVVCGGQNMTLCLYICCVCSHLPLWQGCTKFYHQLWVPWRPPQHQVQSHRPREGF